MLTPYFASLWCWAEFRNVACLFQMPPANQKKPTRRNFAYSEEALSQALNDIRENIKGVREACRHYGVPRSTVQDRLHGRIVCKYKSFKYVCCC